jgi:peptide/nickel transport system permease protein
MAKMYQLAKRTFHEEKLVFFGVSILSLYFLLGLFAPLFTHFGPNEIDFEHFLSAPDSSHLLGTDGNGMDIFSRTMYAIRVDLLVSVVSVSIAVAIGIIIGCISGYFGGKIDAVLMRLLDIFQSFPTFILALSIAAILGPGIFNLIIVIAVVNAPAYARLVRAEVKSIVIQGYIDSARLSGIKHSKILVSHILPNSLLPVRIIAPLNCGWAILTLAGLSFLGLGVPIPGAEWGSMIGAGSNDVVSGVWWTSVVPGTALVTCIFAFTIVGEGFQERQRKK